MVKKLVFLRWAPLLGLLVGMLLATWVGLYVDRDNRAKLDENFQLVAQRATLQLQRRLELYEYGLRGARGAMIAGEESGITRETFRRYSASRDYAREFAGARGFGFIRRVPAEDESRFVQAARADGWPDFSVRQLAPHAGERYVIQYIEPVEDNRPAVGLDIASEEDRRRAALRALRTGAASITDPITLVQADGKKNQGFLILLPVYRPGAPLGTDEQRMAAGYGWVYTPLTIEEVLRDFDFYDGRIALSLNAIEENGKVSHFYSSADMSWPDSALHETTAHIEIYGKEWQITVQALPALAGYLNLTSPWLISAFVVVLSLVGTIASFVLQTTHARVQRLAAEAKLSETDSRYRQLIDGVKDYAIVQLDPDGIVVGWNSGAERIKGYKASEILGRHMALFYPPDQSSREELARKLEIARQEGYNHDEGWRVRKDGSHFWASVTLTPIYDDEHRLTGYSKIARDLNERRAQELERNRLFGLQKAILDGAGLAIIATQMDGTITMFNSSAERLLGYGGDEVIGKLTPAAFHDREEVAERARVLSAEFGEPVKPGLSALGVKALRGEVDTHEWTYITKDGRRIPVLLSVTGIFDEHHNPLGTLGVAADLSEQKRYQAELENAREAAERANTAKSSFLANMSHEIRTPMNAILGMTQLVLQDELEPRQRDLLEKAFAASKALLHILNDVLDYSKVEAGHMRLEERELSLETLLANSASMFTHQAEQKRLEFIIDIPRELPTLVIGDPLRLAQVLSNLLSNAVKFTEQGSVVLGVQLLQSAAGRCRLRFSVKDSGIGMRPEQIDQLFRPFSQADASITRRYGGTGLGLSICKRLVELMGGAMEVRSAPGAGSTFFFDIDMVVAQEAGTDPAALQQLRFKRALIVDDHLAAAHVLQLMLRSWGIEAHCLDNASAAVEQLQSAEAAGSPYDLLLTDWQMPGMNGLELIQRIEEMEAQQDIAQAPTLMMFSSHTLDDLLENIHKHRIAALVTKPVLPSALYNALLGSQFSPASAQNVHTYVASAAPLRDKQVLLAEDNEVNQQVATAFLRSAGMQVTVAGNGQEAVELVQSRHFDALLMDIHMPLMDGLEATRRIRALPACASIPIIAMTAAVMPEDQQACQRAGMDGFVGKPIDPEELVAVLRQWIGATAPAPAGPRIAKGAVPQALQAFAGMDDLDLEGALNRMGGDAGLCARLLLDFASRTAGLIDQLRAIGLDELPAWTHRLKGESANLGLQRIALACAGIESAVKQQPGARPAGALAELSAALQAVSLRMQQVDEATSSGMQSPVTQAPAQEARAGIGPLLAPLSEQLRRQSMQALDTSEQVLQLAAGTPWEPLYRPVHQRISQLQFTSAAAALDDFSLRWHEVGA
ncbi:CHASE domain-containing protein [Acidovorax sp. GBBC 3334]|uniref:CHASE domain-containing hybrid sensor histidine kinase/response regulator n=1 Tax=Acidovorax sp. GBBC 3334 TaxID=2940496 RepID=UPI002302C214|nr:CHASE domain-containing protein [Acidovorax sp. GBBC 3334]MDA8453355.1 CHASE domain-containing protein [Acidovorax sp. GBBC 3334]